MNDVHAGPPKLLEGSPNYIYPLGVGPQNTKDDSPAYLSPVDVTDRSSNYLYPADVGLPKPTDDPSIYDEIIVDNMELYHRHQFVAPGSQAMDDKGRYI